MRERQLTWLLLSSVMLWSAGAFAADWPQWRGPDRDGVWSETGVIKKFSSPQLPIRWRAEIAAGYSGPTVADGRVFVTDRRTQPDEIERVLCFDEQTGKSLWVYSYPCKYNRVGYPDGPRASVTLNEGKAYAIGSMGHLTCLNSADGNVVWKRDLFAELQVQLPIWAISASPIIEGNLLIVMAGGKNGASVMALDKSTGKEVWRALDDPLGYSSPIVIEQAGKRVLVCLTGTRVVGLDPAAGKLYWECLFPPKEMPISAASPVFYDNTLLVSSFYDGSLLIRINPDQLSVSEVWRRRGRDEQNTDSLHCMISTPMMQGDYIYGADSYGQLRCLNRNTGDRVWESREVVPFARWAAIHMVQNGPQTWVFNERGELIIASLSPQEYREISRAKLIEPTTGQLDMRGGVCWAHPAFANRCVYARNDKELVCADLSEK